MTMTSLDALRQAKAAAEAKGISFSASERPALNRVIVRLDSESKHWVNECRHDESADVWAEVLSKGLSYMLA